MSKRELSQKELEALVEGEKPKPKAVFYDSAILNVLESKRQGRRVYDTICFIKETQHGVTDWIPVPAKERHYREYPEEYQYYLKNRQGEKSPSIDIIPGITPAEAQELIDYGITNIELLAKTQVVPPHLEKVQMAARKIFLILKETREEFNRGKETRNQESRSQEGERNVSPPDRQINPTNVGQSVFPASAERGSRETSEEPYSGRRIDHIRQTVNAPVLQGSEYNWSLTGIKI